jgi:hypothetical protein
MKFNGDVDLRQRARRKWFVLLACSLVAGGVWYRGEQTKKKQEALVMPAASPNPVAAPAEASKSFLVDETLVNPFYAPTLALGHAEGSATGVFVRMDHGASLYLGAGQMAAADGGGLWLGAGTRPAATPILISDRARSGNGFSVEPNSVELQAPAIPKSITPRPVINILRLPGQ